MLCDCGPFIFQSCICTPCTRQLAALTTIQRYPLPVWKLHPTRAFLLRKQQPRRESYHIEISIIFTPFVRKSTDWFSSFCVCFFFHEKELQSMLNLTFWCVKLWHTGGRPLPAPTWQILVINWTTRPSPCFRIHRPASSSPLFTWSSLPLTC